MGDNQNWYRQLGALVLLASARAAVEYLTNPNSRIEAGNQLRDAFKQIDYDKAASALIQAIDDAAATSKQTVDQTIDSLRSKSVDAVDEAKHRAKKQAGQGGGGNKMKFIIGLAFGAVLAYFFLNEQRRDEMLDRLTGASGPIQSATSAANQAMGQAQSSINQAQSQANQAINRAQSQANQAVNQAQAQGNQATDAAQANTENVTQQAEQVAQEAAKKTQPNQG